jgi:hypothetical protein
MITIVVEGLEGDKMIKEIIKMMVMIKKKMRKITVMLTMMD